VPGFYVPSISHSIFGVNLHPVRCKWQARDFLGQVLDGNLIFAGRAILSDSASGDIRHGVIIDASVLIRDCRSIWYSGYGRRRTMLENNRL